MVTEALLESHYLKPLQGAFAEFFGGPCTLLKPSQQAEAWLGFDQGYAVSNLGSDAELEDWLKDTLHENAGKDINLFGFFLQFKIVQEMSRKSKQLGWSKPWYRSELSLKPAKSTGKSQHETLVKLTAVPGALCFYACPMVFDSKDIWKEPLLHDVRFVPIDTAITAGWLSNERHHVCFRTKHDETPKWCSEPVDGNSLSSQDWLQHLSEQRKSIPELMKLIRGAREAPSKSLKSKKLSLVPQNLMLVVVGPHKLPLIEKPAQTE